MQLTGRSRSLKNKINIPVEGFYLIVEMNTSPEKQVRKIGTIIFFILLFSYCYFTQPPSNSNSVTRISLVLAIIEDGSLKNDRFQRATSDKVFLKAIITLTKHPV